jgi:hypothetical protein
MVLRKSPKLNKRSHKLALVPLSTNMGQTDHKIILQKILYNNIPVNSRKIEINGQSVYHFELVVLHKIFENTLDLTLWYILYPAMLYELL